MDASAATEPRSGEGQRQGAGDRPTAAAHRGRWWPYALLFAVAGAIVAFNIIRPITVLPRIAPAPGFALTDQTGRSATSEDQRGRLTLYSFSYAGCEAACAPTLSDIARLRQDVAATLTPGQSLSFVTISVDPERDTADRLAAAADAGGMADESIPWRLLSGDATRTRYTIGNGFGVYFSEPKSDAGPDEPRVTFDPRFVLVDQLGIVRAEYRTAAPDPALIARDVNLLVEEAENSEGVARLGYEAAHLFLCYPR